MSLMLDPAKSDAVTPSRNGIFKAAIASIGGAWPIAIGIVALAIPTIIGISTVSWSTEQGSHGPIVLAIALWLLARSWPALLAQAVRGSAFIGGLALAGSLLLYIVARIIGSVVIESGALYLSLMAALYLFVGAKAMWRSWFPLFYLLFVIPPPGSWVATATQPLRLKISDAAVNLLGFFHYPVAREGLMIYVDQYELLVKAACSGLNSMVSLTAIGLFYAYLRHNANVRYCIILFFIIIAMAIVANFIRVIILILITYHFGDQAAQGFLHQFASLTMFAVAMGGVFLIDELLAPVWRPSALEVKA